MLKLHAGVSKKVGLPNYSSASASCTIEAELDSSLLQDHQGFQIVVQRAYQSCEQAVQDQITRLVADDARGPGIPDHIPSPVYREQQPGSPRPSHKHTPHHPDHVMPQELVEVRTAPALHGAAITRRPSDSFISQTSPRPATASQVRAIKAIAARQEIDLVALLRDRYGLQTADQLGIRQASNLIDELKSDLSGSATSPDTHPGHSSNGNGAYEAAGVGGAR
jgi:hypothetical protein